MTEAFFRKTTTIQRKTKQNKKKNVKKNTNKATTCVAISIKILPK